MAEPHQSGGKRFFWRRLESGANRITGPNDFDPCRPALVFWRLQMAIGGPLWLGVSRRSQAVQGGRSG